MSSEGVVARERISRLAVSQPNLSVAILKTLAYSDIFDFPLSADEIHRYLIGTVADLAEVEATVSSLDGVVRQGDLYALAGREAVFDLRRRRSAHAAKLWRQALRYGRLIASLPFVRMVALTGALAAQNTEPGADFDFLIVTEPGRLWSTRAAILGLNRVARLFGLQAELCPNYLITTEHLALEDHDLFTAEELVRMVPISGFDVYEQMRAANRWSYEILPNANGAPQLLKANQWSKGVVARFFESLLRLLPLDWLEGWEMRRKIAKFSRQGMNAETRFSADFCKGHFDGHKGATLEAYELRLAKLGIA